LQFLRQANHADRDGRDAAEAIGNAGSQPSESRQACSAGTACVEGHRPRGREGVARQLAKRQITWLRSMPYRHTVAADANDALPQVLSLAKRLTAA
jgi:hypothetical protein